MPVRPHLKVGVDYTGHVYVREGGQEVKYYILLMTSILGAVRPRIGAVL